MRHAGLLFLLCWFVLAWPWLSGHVTIPYDAKAHFLPQVQFFAHALWQGESPFWTPFVFSGHPQVADPQSLIFSPPFALLALFDPAPGLWSADVTTLITIAAGGLALVIWARDQGWETGAAIFTALAFCFGAAMSWRIQHIGQVVSLSMLAITFMLLSRALSRGSWLCGLAAGITASFMVLERDQVALISVYFLTGYVVWHWFSAGVHHSGRRISSSLPPLIAGSIAGTVLVAIPILLTWLLAQMSNRPEIDFIGAGRGSLHPALMVTWLGPDLFGASGDMEDYWGPPSFVWHDTGLYIAQNMGVLYIGAVSFWLMLAGLFSGSLWHREIRFYTIAMLIMLIYALGWYTPVFRLMHMWLPGIDLFRRPADAVFLIGFLTAILAGHGANRLLRSATAPFSRDAWLSAGVVITLGFAYAAYLATHFHQWHEALEPFVISVAFILCAAAVIALVRWLQPIRPHLAAALLVAFAVLDLGFQNGHGGAVGLPPSTYEVLAHGSVNETMVDLKRRVQSGQTATQRDRVELIGLGFHWPNASLTYGLENTLGYNPVRLALYSAATGAGDTSGMPERKFSPLMPSYASPLANLLGLRYIASGVPLEKIDPSVTPGAFPLVARTVDGYIYENPKALPRVLFATRVQQADFDKLLSCGGMPDINYRNTVLLEGPTTPSLPSNATGSAAIREYHNSEIVIDTTSSDGGWLILNDVWHPWWFVEIDGKPAPMLRSNVLFRAVAVPAGTHSVRFNFRPLRGAIEQLTHGSWGPGFQPVGCAPSR